MYEEIKNISKIKSRLAVIDLITKCYCAFETKEEL
jgi:hypothetical protein